MTFYYLTTSKGRAGCNNVNWHKGEFNTKAEVKEKYKRLNVRVVAIFTEEQFRERYGNSLDNRVQPY